MYCLFLNIKEIYKKLMKTFSKGHFFSLISINYPNLSKFILFYLFFLISCGSINIEGTLESRRSIMISSLLEEVITISALLRIREIRGLIPLNVEVSSARGIMTSSREGGSALQESLIGHEEDAAVVSVASNLHRGKDVLKAIPGGLVGYDLADFGLLVLRVPLDKVELHDTVTLRRHSHFGNAGTAGITDKSIVHLGVALVISKSLRLLRGG